MCCPVLVAGGCRTEFLLARVSDAAGRINNGILEGIHGYANYAPETPGRPAGSINLHIEPIFLAKFLLQRAGLGQQASDFEKPCLPTKTPSDTSNQAVNRNFSIFVFLGLD